MRHSLSAFVLVSVAALGPLGCAATASDEPAESTDDALHAAGENQTKSYVGSFVVDGERFGVALDVSLPTSSIGYQRSEAYKSARFNQRATCQTYNEVRSGTARVRVTGPDGGIRSDATRKINLHGHVKLTDCPDDGLLTSSVLHSNLENDVLFEGVDVLSGSGQTVHVPVGYFGAGWFVVPAVSTFRPYTRPTFTQKTTIDFNSSRFESTGRITVALAEELTISIGVGSTTHGSDNLIDARLVAR